MRRTSASLLAFALSLPLFAACEEPPVETQFREDLNGITYTVDIDNGVSEEILIDVPEGTGSMLIEVRGGRSKYGVFEMVQPPTNGDRRGIRVSDTAVFRTRDTGKPGLVDWIYPNDEKHEVVPGTYSLRIKATDYFNDELSNEEAKVSVYFVKQKFQGTCEIEVDFIVDERALLEEATQRGVEQIVAHLEKNFLPAGIAIKPRSRVNRMDMGAADIQPGNKSVPQIVDNVLAKAIPRGFAGEHAVHVFVVHKIGAEDAPLGKKVFDPNGYAMSLPGPFENRSTSAVMVSTEKYAIGGNLDTEAFASSLTHEIGHFLGLQHTSEEGGDQHDPIGDTPQSNDRDRVDEFERNFMTSALWGVNVKERDTFTPTQAKIMRGHPLCVPKSFTVPTPPPDTESCDLSCTDGKVCSNFSGQQVCTTRCDPASGCPNGECVADHTNTFSCKP